MLEYIYYVALVIALIVFLKGIKEKIDFIKSGQPSPEPRMDKPLERLKFVLKDALVLLRLFKKEKKVGIAHFLLLWGFIILFLNIIVFTIFSAFPDAFRYVYSTFKYMMTLSAILFTSGLILLASIRYILKPSRFNKKYDFAIDDDVVLLLLFYVAFFGIALKEYFRFHPNFANTAVVDFLWFSHAFSILAIFALIPYTKLMHILAAPISVYTKTRRKPGETRPAPQVEDYIGLVYKKDLQRRDLLSSLACMRCGRCQDLCPAFNSKNSLSPMFLIQNVRNIEKISTGKIEMARPYIVKKENKEEIKEEIKEETLVGQLLDMDALWACTTCKACMENCPVYVEHTDIIVEMRRGVIERGEAPPDIRDLLTNIQKQKNPWGEARFKRDQWVKNAEVEVKFAKDSEFDWLWFVGCAHSFDSRNVQVTLKLAKILKDIGVNYAILGREEGCCGNDVRRIGEEGLFQLLKEENLKTFEKYGVKKILATSPHCYNTLVNEHNGYEVKFILETIYDAIKSGKLQLKNPINKKVTYHDPCYLGRYNGIYDLPRKILKSIPGIKLVEMPRNREKSFCCGAGGGNLVREYPGEDRPNNIRAREAAETGAEILAVACPFCMIMLEDGVKSQKLDEKIIVKDVIELVYESAYG
ncbi:MAG: heterodisulfide reductase-related iron-sulfur binding cluster [Archaeoglobaceae archaeon]|nr:heterodisulfide reductase-related iron-sulfur binding cluster [Archaeoglobaceae archaeon]MCX8152453.1 heterodisulfide reductase-related iron-sulfur binding cluster [Archaeoglobaceae archaeon]MDW8013793.1 heterodisulfide reductase-related iron-sulfur binding cluster [Archaeoglobaceae archaeon]